MNTAKVAISIDYNLLKKLDYFVNDHTFKSRSQAIQEAVRDKLTRLDHTRLAQECAKLDPEYERKMAEEGFDEDMKEWPEY